MGAERKAEFDRSWLETVGQLYVQAKRRTRSSEMSGFTFSVHSPFAVRYVAVDKGAAMLTRRILISAVGALSAPHVASAEAAKTLRFVPRFGLTALDPVFSNDTVTRIAGLMIFESLYSVDQALSAKPQMAEGHTIDDDGKRWTIRLRDGLLFHDGQKVLARDCAASIRRWMQRDLLARGMAPRVDAIEVADDRTVVFRLNRPFPRLDFALGKPLPTLLPIMPERLAVTDPSNPVPEVVGSGPFRFLPDAFSAGNTAAFARFEKYLPRNEPPNATSGGRRAIVDRVEWTAMPDATTATNALLTGEVDWLDAPLIDLLPLLRRSRDVVVDRFDPFGQYGMVRLNHLQGPTANLAIRQAIMAAIDPVPIMQAMTGGDPTLYDAPVGVFVPGVPSANAAGMERLGGHKSIAEVRAMLAAAGYQGERLVLLHATDVAFFHTASQIIAAQLTAVGMTIDDVAVDQGTVVQRRNSKEPRSIRGAGRCSRTIPAAPITSIRWWRSACARARTPGSAGPRVRRWRSCEPLGSTAPTTALAARWPRRSRKRAWR